MKNFRLRLLQAFLVVLVIEIAAFVGIYLSFPSWTERGQFGDMFGAVTALFSGLALAGVILAIVLQTKELELQRKELELNRAELKKQSKAQNRQAFLIKEAARINAVCTLARIRVDTIRDTSTSGLLGPDNKESPEKLRQSLSDLEEAATKSDDV